MATFDEVSAYLQKELDLEKGQADNIIMEANRCRGNDNKERRMLHRVYRTQDTFDKDEGYYLHIISAAALTQYVMAEIGPFVDQDTSIETYNEMVGLFGFHDGMVILSEEEKEALRLQAQRKSDILSLFEDDDDLDWGDDDDDW